MKYITYLVLILLIISCGTRKRVVENAPKEASENEKPKDSIVNTYTPGKESEVISEFDRITNTRIGDEKAPEKPATPTEVFNHASWNDLLQKHVSTEGRVDYPGFKRGHKALSDYIISLNDHLPTPTASKTYILSYWINAYNAMTIDLILRHYPVESIKDIEKPWDQRHWKLGNKWYNLNEIEHEILRKMNEPRIHFAIVCASFSCPKLLNSAFTPNNLESKLTLATEAFLSDTTKNNLSENDLELSKIFQWFSKDFKQNGSLIDFLNRYSKIRISDKAKKRFKPYNWDLND